MDLRQDWTKTELQALYDLPLLLLISKSHQIHIQLHSPLEVQVCSLISIKTGGCSEDCKYCAQSSRYQTSVVAQPLMPFEEVLKEAKKAVKRGATRICLGAAWRGVRDNQPFKEILGMVTAITQLGVEVCCTLGMLSSSQARQLKMAGLYAYNHNLDSSEKFYRTIITTRTYQERLETLANVQEAGLSVCCGGILGMGERVEDRLELLHTLCTRKPHPESVPINKLTQIPGTPLENQSDISFWEFLRIVAIARIVMPQTIIRMSCGRIEMSYVEQALCFMAGANSIFAGEKLLTVANHSLDKDENLFKILGLKLRSPFKRAESL